MLVFLPGESKGQRRLARYSPWISESDTTEVAEHARMLAPGIYQASEACCQPSLRVIVLHLSKF